MPYSNLSATLSDADKTAILTKINEITALLPFLLNLTPDERRGLQAMGDGNEPFITKAITYAEANPQFVPPYLNVAEFRKDVNLVIQITPILQALAQLMEGLRDTALAAGSEAFAESRVFYKSVQVAAGLNVPGADTIAEDLGQRFAGQGQSTPPPEPPPEPAP
jgi:hypothetical protein